MPSDSKRTLTEISHLFLSSVRERATGAAPRPMRVPPKQDVSIDLTPEEFAEVFSSRGQDELSPVAPVVAVIGSHLGGRQAERVRDLARHLASHEQRIGLIELDATSCRVSCFEPSLDSIAAEPIGASEEFNAQQLIDAMEELNVDVDRWILSLPNPRAVEARPLLRQVTHWTLLSTCDHDGIVAAYRSIKGLTDEHHAELSLAVLDAKDEADAQRVFTKLSSVCQQFLAWTVSEHVTVRPQEGIAEHTIHHWQPTHDKAALATTAQWQVIAGFVSRAQTPVAAQDEQVLRQENPIASPAPASSPRRTFSRVVHDEPSQEPLEPATAQAALEPALAHDGRVEAPEVIEINGHETSSEAVLSAILHHPSRGLVECPVRAPGFDAGRLAVDRDRRLILISVAREGLSDLGAIGRAYNWLIENRNLVAMALPQLSIDAHALPTLRLLIDHADLKADQLQPLLASKTVQLETYRPLRWGSKTGLLLEAA